MTWPHYDRIDREGQLLATLAAIPFVAFMAWVFWADWAPDKALWIFN